MRGNTLSAITTTSQTSPTVPAWVGQWVGPNATLTPLTDAAASRNDPWHGPQVAGRASYGKRFSLVQVRVHHAHRLPDLLLQETTTRAYHMIRAALERGGAHHAVRFWNFIPGIVNDAGGGLDRYMVFNAGRYAAFADWFDAPGRGGLAPHLATATGVGHAGQDLLIYALADQMPGKPVENPRQCAAYMYSETYGPLPPCFARATVVTDGTESGSRQVLIGGTASVRGEDSMHVGDLPAQVDETFENIAALLEEAQCPGLDRLSSLRVYHVDPAERDSLYREVVVRVPHLSSAVEMVHAPLCRRELHVEIEGVAGV